jgi:hypothetical protein
MKKHRLGTEPKEVLFRSDSILRLAKSKNTVKYLNLITIQPSSNPK